MTCKSIKTGNLLEKAVAQEIIEAGTPHAKTFVELKEKCYPHMVYMQIVFFIRI